MTTIDTVTISSARITQKTDWIFVEVVSAGGIAGIGEATLNGMEASVFREAERLCPGLVGEPLSVASIAKGGLPKSLPEAALVSALDQAVRDAAARAAGEPLWCALGGIRRREVPVYANINRRTIDRSPAGFAESAKAALGAGHGAFKLAPFDEATTAAIRGGDIRPILDKGFARVAAVRNVVGQNSRLMVDCHWRFDETFAQAAIRRAAELKLHWVECPMPETLENLEAIRRLRDLANSLDVRLAGCEQGIGLEGFAPFLEAGCYDVMMPDIKYIGGLDELFRLSDAATKAGVAISPHNPSGPICHAVSLQVSAALPEFDCLESQFDESPLFGRLVGFPFSEIRQGMEAIPAGAGCGVVIDRPVLESVTGERKAYGAMRDKGAPRQSPAASAI